MSKATGGFAVCIALGASLAAIGCGGANDSTSGAKALRFGLTDAGCDPHEASVPAGPLDFEVTNEGTSNVTELEVLGEGDRILGEVENLSDGLSGNFSLTLERGEYTLYCPGGETERGTLTVTEGKGATKVEGEDEAVERYRSYVERNADELVTKTEAFVAAVEAGEVAKVKGLYPGTRVPFERIEPVAESLGPLDPAIDAREGDVPDKQFGGFHRIEQALWVDEATRGMGPVAERLLADVRSLQRKVKTVKLQAAQIANGANELLGEVSASKITGEEERYSHTDLWDFEANVDGAQAAFDSLAPILRERDPELASEIESRFADVLDSLERYRRGDGFVYYDELSEADTRALSRQIDALAEPLSLVAAKVSG